jgi:MoaA/NifB/PqqE/SkfB family radical SAM enzyme
MFGGFGEPTVHPGLLDMIAAVNRRGIRTEVTTNERGERAMSIGLSSVVLRRNVADLSAMDELARSVGADTILVSNVLPYSADMEKEMLWAQADVQCP